jgi:hypothetical protein
MLYFGQFSNKSCRMSSDTRHSGETLSKPSRPNTAKKTVWLKFSNVLSVLEEQGYNFNNLRKSEKVFIIVNMFVGLVRLCTRLKKPATILD